MRVIGKVGSLFQQPKRRVHILVKKSKTILAIGEELILSEGGK